MLRPLTFSLFGEVKVHLEIQTDSPQATAANHDSE